MPPPPERRAHTRFKIKVPVELHVEGSNAPLRCATSDLSLDGCYIESMLPLPAGTEVELKLETTTTLLILGTVVTCDPQVGNGIHFRRMLPEDIEELQAFLSAAEKESAETKKSSQDEKS
jgi:hypothetical protein